MRILTDLCDAKRDYLDIGAWIGPTALHASTVARHVHAFEPDPVAFRFLAQNVGLNEIDNISLYPVAVATRTSVSKMGSFAGGLGDSTSSLLNDGESGIEVVTLSWDTLTRAIDLEGVSLIKIDVEGGEFELLPAMLDYLERHRPALYLSTHTPYLLPDNRKDAISKVFEMLSFYGRCLNGENSEPGYPESSIDRFADRFAEFLFLDDPGYR